MEDKELFNTIAENYSRKDLVTYSKRCRKLRLDRSLKNLQLPIRSILEIGCGAGFTAQYIKGSYIHYTGIDYSEKLIELAERINDSGNTSFFCKDVNDFSCEEKFDLILMIGVLHHIKDPLALLKDLEKYLSPDGIIVINEPQRGNPLINILRRIRKKTDESYSSSQNDFSKKELEALFIEAGYMVRLFPQGVFSTPLAETLVFPKPLGNILSWISAKIDPPMEFLLEKTGLSFLAWNIVAEAKLKKNNLKG